MDELVWQGDTNGKARPIIQLSHRPQSDGAVCARYLCAGKHVCTCRWRADEKPDFLPRLIVISIAAADRANWNVSELTNAS